MTHGPAVASLWIGGELSWLHALSLASFVHHGHEVTLFHTGAQAPQVPQGVRTSHAAEIWDPAAHGHGEDPASMVSDLFRLFLLQQTDAVWIDTDVLCLRPLPKADYHVGREHGGMTNGAVLRLPTGSATLGQLMTWFADPEFVPHWLNEKHQAAVAQAAPGQRLRKSYRLVKASLGPRALHHTLRDNGEARHLRPPEVFYPVRGVFADCFFNPKGGIEAWLSDQTLAVHLYASMIRPYHQKHQPYADSFIAKFAKEIGFAVEL